MFDGGLDVDTNLGIVGGNQEYGDDRWDYRIIS